MTITLNGATGIITTDGSASSPSLKNSSTAGLAFIGTNSLSLVTSNTEQFRINDSGALLIGGTNSGIAGQILTSQGAGLPPVWSSIITNSYIYTTPGSGTWTKPSTGTYVLIRLWGAGGSGSKGGASGSYGGGGGAYLQFFAYLADFGATASYVVGAGGSGVTTGQGIDGGNSTFTNPYSSSLLTAYAGGGGSTVGPTPGGGGGLFAKETTITTVTDPFLGGEGGGSTTDGNPAYFGGGGGGGTSSTVAFAGGAPVGGGGAGGAGSIGGTATSGSSPGGGGGGCFGTGTSGAGGNGRIEVWVW